MRLDLGYAKSGARPAGVVLPLHLGDRPGPARQAAMVGKPLSLPWLRGRVDWHIHGPASRPGGSTGNGREAATLESNDPVPMASDRQMARYASALVQAGLFHLGGRHGRRRSNVSADVLRSFSKHLKNVADELEAPPKPGHTTH